MYIWGGKIISIHKLNHLDMSELERCELAKAKGYTYCPKTGEIRGVKGNVIRKKNHCGYIVCQIWLDSKKKEYEVKAHRLAWYLYYGKLPNNFIDHKDGVRDNNVIDNLRDVTKKQNQWNQTKAKGYTLSKRDKKYVSQIKVNGKYISLGYYKTKEEARSAYLQAKQKYHQIPNP